MKHCAFLIVDIQNDFMPGWALGVPGAHDIVPIINHLMLKFSCVIASRDWHPKNHVSFAEVHPGKHVGDSIEVHGVEQILWPVHCVQETAGADFVPALERNRITYEVYKGIDPNIESYSAFFDNAKLRSTGLHEYIQQQGISCVVIAGLTTEYCVLYSVKDASDLGIQTYVVKDACRAINVHPGDEQRAYKEMEKRGAILVDSSTLMAMQ
jgi:nicotinamidase/pyrazinamidase